MWSLLLFCLFPLFLTSLQISKHAKRKCISKWATIVIRATRKNEQGEARGTQAGRTSYDNRGAQKGGFDLSWQ